MPNYRSISISLISQFDIKAIPEFVDVKKETNSGNGDSSLTELPREKALLGPSVTIYVPIHSGSQFWIRYAVAPPVPQGHYFFFKLFMNGSPITSWGVGEQDQWKGKAMFTLEDMPTSMGHGIWQRRNFLFSKENANGLIELRVFRAKGRESVEPPNRAGTISRAWNSDRDGWSHAEKNSNTNSRETDTGLMESSRPINFYKYALIDPLDAPFATFRYLTRDWKQLEEMGTTLNSYDTDDIPDNRPYSISLGSCSEDTSVISDGVERSPAHGFTGRYGFGQVIEGSTASSGSDEMEDHDSFGQQSEPAEAKQISNSRFDEKKVSLTPPPGARFPPPIDVSRNSVSATWRFGPGADKKENTWMSRTPSPVKKVVEAKDVRSPRMLQLRSAVGNAWRRSMSPVSY